VRRGWKSVLSRLQKLSLKSNTPTTTTTRQSISGTLYIGSYTQNAEDGAGHVPGERGSGLTAVRIDSSSSTFAGAPHHVEAEPKLVNPSYLTVDSARGILYAVEESITVGNEDQGVCSFELKKSKDVKMKAEFIERRFVSVGDRKGACHVILWPLIDPSMLLVSCYTGPFCALKLATSDHQRHHSIDLSGLGGPFPGPVVARYVISLLPYCNCIY
jgi:hypothetical protein